MTGNAAETMRPTAGALARGTAIGLVLLLTGCSYVPDWANPVEWYDSVAGGDAPPPEQADTAIARPVPGANQSFPTLASVPDRPQAPTSSGERQRVASGLVADRDNAKYTEQVANAALAQEKANLSPPPPPSAMASTAATSAATASSATASSATTGPATAGARPPTLGAAPPAPPPAPPPSTVAQGSDSGTGRVVAPPPAPPSPSMSASTMTAPASRPPTMAAAPQMAQAPAAPVARPAPSAAPSRPAATDLPAYADGRPRMAVPQIVQRVPATEARQSGAAAAAPSAPPALADTAPRPSRVTPSVLATAPAAPAPTPPMPQSAPTLPSQVRAATAPTVSAPTVTAQAPAAPTRMAPPMASQAPVQMASRPPATMPPAGATAQRLNLPVGQDQRALEDAFASSVAAQQGSSVAMLPPGGFAPAGVAPGGAVIDSGGTTYIGGGPAGMTAGGGYGQPVQPLAGQAGLVATINFGNGSARLGSGDLRTVREVAAAARQGGRIVRVVGHSSQRTGNMDFEKHLIANFNMSLDRANAVARALMQAGVPAEQVVVEAVGDQQPLYFEFMPNGEAENRRAEIFLE